MLYRARVLRTTGHRLRWYGALAKSKQCHEAVLGVPACPQVQQRIRRRSRQTERFVELPITE